MFFGPNRFGPNTGSNKGQGSFRDSFRDRIGDRAHSDGLSESPAPYTCIAVWLTR